MYSTLLLTSSSLVPGDGIPDSIEYNATKIKYRNLTSSDLSDVDGDGIPNWYAFFLNSNSKKEKNKHMNI